MRYKNADNKKLDVKIKMTKKIRSKYADNKNR